MEVDPDRAAARATVDGTDYWFCAQGCRDEFLTRQTNNARATPLGA